jgi:formylglycine-generating enzyme required for sulfatase activity
MEGANQYYQVLGLKPGASKEEVAQAYKVLTKTWYPQRNSEDKSLQQIAGEKLKEIEEAYVRLMTPVHTPLNQENPPSSSKLEVRSEPTGAKVYVDEREVGETPLILPEINPGQHTIRVFKEGFNPSKGNVEIKPSEQKALIAHLKKIETHGSLVVQTRPTGIMVHLDGKPVGTSPCSVNGLSPGSHKLSIIKEGYENWGRTVVIESGQNSIVNIELKGLERKTGEFFRDSYLRMEFIFIKGGMFEMGDVFGDGNKNERPVHQVHVDDFWIGKFLVTQEQWKRIIGDLPFVHNDGNNYPVQGITWSSVQDFVNKLNEKTGMKYRLPTEAEWEYAARSGGKKEKWAGTDLESEIDEYAWYCPWYTLNSKAKTQPVGRKKPNSAGLYDMSGNLWEWVQDSYDKHYYGHSPQDNPQYSGDADSKVIRGGSSRSPTKDLRTTRRNSWNYSLAKIDVGFRLVLSAKDEVVVVREARSIKREVSERNPLEPLVSDIDGIDSEPKRYISPPPTEYKDERRVGHQPVKPSIEYNESRVGRQTVEPQEGGLGVGAKIGLTIAVLVIGGILRQLVRDFVGTGIVPGGLVLGAITYTIWKIWSRSGRTT